MLFGEDVPVGPKSLTALAVSALLALTACGSGGSTVGAPPATGCTAPVDERLDPNSVIHLFPGAPEPRYLTDPPTSGPHQLGQPPVGVISTPIPRPRQVAMLESGYVIVQHSGPLAPELAALAGPHVVVAPPVAPLPSPVVATAWTWKLSCRSADPPAVVAIRAFIAAHEGVGFSG